MDIQAIVSLDRTECAVQCNSKKRILEIIADIAAKQNENIDQATVLNSLMARERMGSTGIGNGIALPHGRLPGLEKVIAIVVTSTPAIDFDALDEKHRHRRLVFAQQVQKRILQIRRAITLPGFGLFWTRSCR